MVPTPATSPITAEDMKIEVRISPPQSAPRDFFCEGPIDLKVAVKTPKTAAAPALLYGVRPSAESHLSEHPLSDQYRSVLQTSLYTSR